MIGSVNTDVAMPREEDESKLSKFLNWADLAMKAGMSVNGAINAGQATPEQSLQAPKAKPYFLDWNNGGNG